MYLFPWQISILLKDSVLKVSKPFDLFIHLDEVTSASSMQSANVSPEPWEGSEAVEEEKLENCMNLFVLKDGAHQSNESDAMYF